MLIRRVYMMALEHPESGFMRFLGKVDVSPTSLRSLDFFTKGYGWCQIDLNIQPISGGWSEFLEWLRARDYWPSYGWAGKIIEEVGDGKPAFDRFKELLFEYLESEIPEWFVEFNRFEQPGLWLKFESVAKDYSHSKMVPARADIRIEKHIRLAAEASQHK